MIILYVLTLAPVIVAVVGDKLLEKVRYLPLKAFTDSSTHGIIGAISWLVILFQEQSTRSYILNQSFEVVLCGSLASFIDVDHFVAARSLSLSDAVNLGTRRPPLHATSLMFIIVLPLIIIAKVLKKGILLRLSLLAVTAVGSHHIRDAVRRGLWFPPFGSTPPLPYFFYLFCIGILPHIIALLIPTSVNKNHPYFIV